MGVSQTHLCSSPLRPGTAPNPQLGGVQVPVGAGRLPWAPGLWAAPSWLSPSHAAQVSTRAPVSHLPDSVTAALGTPVPPSQMPRDVGSVCFLGHREQRPPYSLPVLRQKSKIRVPVGGAVPWGFPREGPPVAPAPVTPSPGLGLRSLAPARGSPAGSAVCLGAALSDYEAEAQPRECRRIPGGRATVGRGPGRGGAETF